MIGLAALSGETGLPILVSLCSWPEDIPATARRFRDLDAMAMGTNCGTSPDDVIRPTEALAAPGGIPLIAKPSGFSPPVPGPGPEAYARLIPELLRLGVRLIGGCCGTDEHDIAAMRAAIDHSRKVHEMPRIPIQGPGASFPEK